MNAKATTKPKKSNRTKAVNSAATEAASELPSPRKSVTLLQLSQYLDDKVRPMYSDLMRDCGASEMFVIEGDSLVRIALSDPHLDWTHGGQWLHFIYSVERFLYAFKSRGGQFRVLFFRDHRNWHYSSLDRTSPSYGDDNWTLLLARDLVMRHLRATGTQVDELDGWTDRADHDAWCQYLAKTQPAFIVIFDPTVSTIQRVRGCAELPLSETEAYTYLALTLECLVKHVPVVYASNITQNGDSLMGFIATGISGYQNKKIFSHDKVVKETCSRIWAKSRPDPAHVIGLASTRPPGSIHDVALAFMLEASDDPQEDEWHLFLAKCFCIHRVLLQYLPIQARALKMPILPSDRLRLVIYEWLQDYYYEIMSLLEWKSLEPRISCDLADLLDGRLFFAVITYMLPAATTTATAHRSDRWADWDENLDNIPIFDSVETEKRTSTVDQDQSNPLGFTAQMLDALQAMWDDVIPYTDLDDHTNILPVHLSSIDYPNKLGIEYLVKSSLTNPLPLEQNDKTPNICTLFPIDNKLMDNVVGDVFQGLAIQNREEQDDTTLATKSAKEALFSTDYHWHSGADLDEDFVPRRRRGPLSFEELRGNQFYARFLEFASRSLPVVTHPIIVASAKNSKHADRSSAKERKPHQGNKRQKAPVISKKQQILDRQNTKTLNKQLSEEGQQWANTEKSLQSIVHDKTRGPGVALQLLRSYKLPEALDLQLPIAMYKLELLAQQRQSTSNTAEVILLVDQIVNELAQTSPQGCTPAETEFIHSLLLALGFADLATSVAQALKPKQKKKRPPPP
eukprot:TRINITY_DN7380_c0_g1_i3.p1 TRINITY_DN7380_c0_g1~~TRINITY_DN7380_c0_g1_i3.p1  ORF type:complete len:795 (-),score=102.80 TRINITY_DN7380_c0_g1_i3:742-3126(-)